jgi:hypothetical protein
MKKVVMTRIWPPRIHLAIGVLNGSVKVLCRKSTESVSAHTALTKEVTCRQCLFKIRRDSGILG